MSLLIHQCAVWQFTELVLFLVDPILGCRCSPQVMSRSTSTIPFHEEVMFSYFQLGPLTLFACSAAKAKKSVQLERVNGGVGCWMLVALLIYPAYHGCNACMGVCVHHPAEKQTEYPKRFLCNGCLYLKISRIENRLIRIGNHRHNGPAVSCIATHFRKHMAATR